MAGFKFVFALSLALLVVAPVALAIECGEVSTNLIPCIEYLRTDGKDAPPPKCCRGVDSLNNAARTTKDRQDACRCIQDAAKEYPGLNSDTAAALPSKCGVNIPYNISTSTNCASIK